MSQNTTAVDAPSTHLFPVPRAWLTALTISMIVPWGILAAVFARSFLQPAVQTNPPVASEPKPSSNLVSLCRPGPWGVLEKLPIVISPPLEFISEMNVEPGMVTWHFPKMSREEVTTFLNSCRLSPSQENTLLEQLTPDTATSGYQIKASQEVVASLTPESRAKIYHFLGAFDQNRSIEAAFRFSGPLDQWINRRIPVRVLDVFKKYVYSNGATLFLADVGPVLDSCSDVNERRLALKMMTRASSYMIKLRVDETSDIEGLVNYWGKGGRTKDIRSLLESLASQPGGQEIDIIHLLPPFVRQRLYTYPHPSQEAEAARRNCYWTAMNFFNPFPDDQFTDLSHVAKVIMQDYYPIQDNLQLGDVIFFGTSENDIRHAAVYVADDIVFTKNGSKESRPWMLSSLESMKEYYPIPKDKLWIRYYRNKKF